mmetsp:Transcript_56706/g.135051  ORF Transcript_56706/g.135051 Transcript_56706/m.135051 type:complete len:271 (-) Transcript_56706:109-921(-)
MSARSTAVVACCLLAGVSLVLSQAFVPTSGLPAAGSSARVLRGQTAPQETPSTSSSSAAAFAAAAVLAGSVVGALRSRAQVAQQAARRELAVAYEDSGIDLMDNGKFAQGLVGSEHAYGRYEFDPIGFSKWTELVPYFREAELKHGRIAMLAWVGLVVPDFVRIPGEAYSFEAVPRVIDAHDALAANAGPNFQIILFAGILELCCAKKVFEWNSVETAGDYGLTKFFPSDPEAQKMMRVAELKNGRLAMIAFGGAITQAVITSKPFPWCF